MIKIIFHQIKNQKRLNGWIFVELLVVSIFLWLVIDPLYVLLSNRLIPAGYEQEGLYSVSIGKYAATHPRFSQEANADSILRNNYSHQLNILRQMPEVESYCIASNYSIPSCGAWNGGQLATDTAETSRDSRVHVQRFETARYLDGDIFRTYRIIDVHTGEILRPDADVRKIYIVAYTARLLFGTTDVVGRTVFQGKDKVEIGGVFSDIKYADYEQPFPLEIIMSAGLKKEMDADYWKWRYCFVFRLKEGVDASAFVRRFNAEVVPTLAIGNWYCCGLRSFADWSREFARQSGVSNKLRLQFALSGFSIFCIFLGMLGTFWIRTKTRRQEIGLMRSMGASRGTIVRQFLTECWLLMTLAFIFALVVVGAYVYLEGMTVGSFMDMGHTMSSNNPIYWQNQALPHFFLVTIITYVLLLVVALIGTMIPVSQAVNSLPAEALREE